jgi:hypothetical protein
MGRRRGERPMADTVDELTVQYEENGQVLVQETAKEVLTKGVWATIMFKYRNRDRKTGELGPEQVTIRRYKKSGGQYRSQSKFNISGEKQAKEIAKVLMAWF